MNDFFDELSEGDIQLRDKYQFELKSEYSPIPGAKQNLYTSEFFIFVPSALQINPGTYTKKQFYFDQTNFIRLKTPRATLKELYNNSDPQAPLQRIYKLSQKKLNGEFEEVLKELKLYANIVRSSLRTKVSMLLDHLKHAEARSDFAVVGEEISEMVEDLTKIRQSFLGMRGRLGSVWDTKKGHEYWRYIDEFLSRTIEDYLSGLLVVMREAKRRSLNSADREIRQLIKNEVEYREQVQEKSTFADDPEKQREYEVYRRSLLKKFAYDALFLKVSRKKPSAPFKQFSAAVAAGLAMFFYVAMLSYYGFTTILIDSTAFIAISVFLYILKDRMKEGLRSFSSRFFSKYFPDYKTKIETPDGKTTLGVLKESFGFLSGEDIPSDINEIRNTEFHTELEEMERREECLYFRKEITLKPKMHEFAGQYYELNDIFRYNISRYLMKAGDSYKERLELNIENKDVQEIRCPKVYHINIIMREIRMGIGGQEHHEIKKVRLVLDKEGIKRIENVEGSS